ncbi:MAG: NifB/NifX family molybdenum-iron cluster-binding protein [Spirochaetota bacterium]
MKIALPARGNLIDGHFGHCEHFKIFTADANEITGEETLIPPAECGCKSSVVGDLAKMGVTVMIAGNMGQGAVNKLEAAGIIVLRGVDGEPRAAVEAYLAGSLKDSGVGCSAHEHGHDCENH